MKKLIAVCLIVALIFSTLPVHYLRAQQIVPSCVPAILAVVIGGVMVYGIYRICQYANQQQEDDPPAEVPAEVWTNAPAPGAPFQVLPPLRLQFQLFGQPIVGQHQDFGYTFRDRTNWITDFSVAAQADGTMVLSDANGVTLTTNAPTVVNDANGHQWRIFDFTAVPLGTNQSNARLFRLVGQRQ